jgi:D-beta-D-heptose 7-phosphate kinase/D-beta-D-heptose 1-phosphate adenosyltransferase
MALTSRKIVSLSSLKKLIARYRKAGKTIAFTNGCFDILHYGHVSYLEAAKKNNSRILIIGLNSDRSVRSLEKGPNRPIVPQTERAKVLAALACVDHVVLFNEPTPQQLVEALMPDVMIKGADWKGKKVAGADAVKANGGRVEFIAYIKGLSTTNIIAKISRSCRVK